MESKGSVGGGDDDDGDDGGDDVHVGDGQVERDESVEWWAQVAGRQAKRGQALN